MPRCCPAPVGSALLGVGGLANTEIEETPLLLSSVTALLRHRAQQQQTLSLEECTKSCSTKIWKGTPMDRSSSAVGFTAASRAATRRSSSRQQHSGFIIMERDPHPYNLLQRKTPHPSVATPMPFYYNPSNHRTTWMGLIHKT